jgi:hypothetical protein
VGKVFVSYSWKQGPLVWDRLVPVLRASGIEILIDRERFIAGKDVLGQMNKIQDQADRHCQRRLNFPEKCRAKNPWFSSVGDQPAY